MSEPGNPRRRRGLGDVTPNACTECRKKRAKCDGQVPCGRCAVQSNIDCVYETPVRQSKENMRAEIEELRAAQRRTDRVFSALVSTDTSDKLLGQLRSGQTIDEITKGLEEPGCGTSGSKSQITTFTQRSDEQAIGSTLQPLRRIGSFPISSPAFSDTRDLAPVSSKRLKGTAFSSWHGGGESSSSQHLQDDHKNEDMMRWEPDVSSGSGSNVSFPLIGMPDLRNDSESPAEMNVAHARRYGQSVILGSNVHNSPRENRSGWTAVTTNDALVDHLMALYFCWEYPTFASFSKEHYMDDFKSGTDRYCSSLLVNAMLALGCRFSSQPEAWADPNDQNTSGDHFYAEATRLLEVEDDQHLLTKIQALGLMSLREASCGRTNESLFLSGQSIRLAIEIGLHQHDIEVTDYDSRVELEVKSATFWGAFSLDQAWALKVGRLPQFSRNLRLVDKPEIIQHVEHAAWVPYTDDGAPLQRPCTQPSNVRSVFKSFCELSEVIHRSLYALYSPGVVVTSKVLLTMYTEFLQWYESLTPVLRLGQNFTPAVLFAHMHYHNSIHILFRPFIRLNILDSNISPKEVYCQTADAISALVRSYTELYTLRRTPSLVPYFVLTASIAHMATRGTSETGTAQLRQGVAELHEMRSCHTFAGQALDILRSLAVQWQIELPGDGKSSIVEDLRKTPPAGPESLNLFCPRLEHSDIVSPIGTVKEGQNPLFWVFPLQGRPVLRMSSLETSGFIVPES